MISTAESILIVHSTYNYVICTVFWTGFNLLMGSNIDIKKKRPIK